VTSRSRETSVSMSRASAFGIVREGSATTDQYPARMPHAACQ
jgi:hypothetical protein